MQNYELIAQIGKGSYGRVYTVRSLLVFAHERESVMKLSHHIAAQARNYEDCELYVLKRIPFDDAAKADADAALREANVLGRGLLHMSV